MKLLKCLLTHHHWDFVKECDRTFFFPGSFHRVRARMYKCSVCGKEKFKC